MEQITLKMTNRRGSKRVVSVAACYELLCSVWNDLPIDFISDCATSTQLNSAFIQELKAEAETRFADALKQYYASFAVPSREYISKESYYCLEAVPFIAGISSIMESVRHSELRSLLFQSKGALESPLFPSFESVLNESKSVFAEKEATKSAVSLNEPAKLNPTASEIDAFCRCLDGIVENSSSFSEADRGYFSMLKERIRRQYLPQWLVCWRKQGMLHGVHGYGGRNAECGDHMSHLIDAENGRELASADDQRNDSDLHLQL